MRRPDTKTSMIFGLIFFVVSLLLFALPAMFSEVVTMSYNVDFIGQASEFTLAGAEKIAVLVLIPLVCGASGAFFGLQMRRMRQAQLLAASHPSAPDRLRTKYKRSFFDRVVFQLSSDGTDFVKVTSKNE